MYKVSRTATTLLALSLAASSSWAAAIVATWTKKAPLAAFRSPLDPGPRSWTTLTFDSLNGKLVFFGGSAGANFVSDIWQYDTLADKWTAVEYPAENCPGTFGFSGPDGRDTQTVVYDEFNHLYWSLSGGGHKCSGTAAAIKTAQAGTNSTTIVDASLPGDVTSDYFKDWTVTTSGGKAFISSYDSTTKTIKLATSIAGLNQGATYQIKVWTDGGSWYYSPESRQWGRLQLEHWGYTGPTPHVGYGSNTPAAAYSNADKTIVMFGGSINGVTLNDTWALDTTTKTWVLKKPNAEVGPYKRSEINSAMVYDSVNDVFILFGGRCDGSDSRCPGGRGPLGDTWAYQLSTNTWTQMITPVSPPARMTHQMAFDQERGVVVMFGGTSVKDIYSVNPTEATLFRDLWIYDYAKNIWTDVTPTVTPPGRYIGTMAYDPIAKVSVLFGGREPGQAIQGGIWTLQLTESDSNVNQVPIAAAIATPASGSLETTFSFDASASRDSDGEIVSYLWDFGDGSTASGPSASHRFASAGSFNVVVTITDDRGATAQKALMVQVSNGDVTPDAFSFAAVSGAALNTWVVSGPVTVAGIDGSVPVSITGGEYSIDGAPFTAQAGVIAAGQAVRVRVLSSGANSSPRSATLSVGSVAASFNVTTLAVSGDVKPFAFVPETKALLNTMVISGTATLSVNTPTAVSITGGEYSVNGGVFTTAPGLVSNGQGIRVRMLSASTFATTKTAIVTVGSVNAAYTVTTVAEDITPDAFAFAAVSNVALNSPIISNGVGVWGVNTATPISITGGEYSVSGAAYTSAPGTVEKGQTVRVRLNRPGF